MVRRVRRMRRMKRGRRGRGESWLYPELPDEN